MSVAVKEEPTNMVVDPKTSKVGFEWCDWGEGGVYDRCKRRRSVNAAILGSTHILKALLESGGNPNVSKASGATPAYIAAECGTHPCTPVARIHSSPLSNNTRSHSSCLYVGHVDSLEVLHQHGCDLHIIRTDGSTLPFAAAQNGEKNDTPTHTPYYHLEGILINTHKP